MSVNTTVPEGTQIVVMGVSASGKSTIGALIAGALGVPFVDGDALHPQSNIEKMAGGHPLNDDDRWPWLAIVGETLATAGAAGTGMVIACSALRRGYRQAIIDNAPEVRFIHLDGSREVLAARIEGRSDHFMPPSLLDSQFATLEPLAEDEPGIVVNIDQTVAAIVAEAVEAITGNQNAA
ncbi:carbohydrate kinase (thermoresistant glucokinase family) [Okibacterium sp. HSC-33S16]|uniref:gluconokinase n=1 Tax=Okibacterium sp. HSC-33S16 TaxID=2910965 RepID=UPI00209F8117|nr:gluconokinase [Okibacterium sp. HSC-33S16]MCP2030272.1 carbohydrate kinase (thermoresistant glucokinase family) [Okibacterium sp. HSC-33S16]